jgi:hypothetical protein
MKLYLKDGWAYLMGQGYVPKQNLPVEIDVPDFNINDYKMSVKINDQPSRSCTKSFSINVTELEKPQLKIQVKVTHKKSGVSQVFKMDPLDLRESILIGNNLEHRYPSTITELKEEVKALKHTVKIIRTAVIDIGKRGELL